MRGLTRRWIVDETAANNDRSGGAATSLVDRVLRARGLCDPADISRFCEPKLTHLHDPGLMPNVDAAVARLIDAVRRDELIAIYGDYDVDGVAATAILYHTIKTAAPNARLRTYIPHRLDEGYGINCEALKQLRSEGASVVISVDCGITARTSALTAREIGLDLIITDHHNLPQASADCDSESPADCAHGLPVAVAVVHPRLPGSVYPFGELCGAGVAFKVAWRFATTWCNSERVSASLQQMLINLLPLAALGTIADVVPLVGENRILACFGLRRIKHTPLPGLRALIEAAGLAGEEIDCDRVGFVLGPRLNACGRMGHAADAVRMLTDAPADEAIAIAKRLTAMNQQRQAVERGILDQASRMAEDRGMATDDCRAIVLAHEQWHPGVVGIVCTRLVERFGRPTILLQQQGDVCKGSARSIEGYSIHDALCAASMHLQTWGGHAAAAGLSLATANLQAMTEAIVAHANERIAAEQLTPSLSIDCDADLAELDLATVQRLHAMAPFGQGNRRPTLRVRGATVQGQPRQIGAQGRHLQVRMRQDWHHGSQRVVRAVWWSAAEHASSLAAGVRIDAAIEPRINEWNGLRSVEAEVRDIHLCGQGG